MNTASDELFDFHKSPTSGWHAYDLWRLTHQPIGTANVARSDPDEDEIADALQRRKKILSRRIFAAVGLLLVALIAITGYYQINRVTSDATCCASVQPLVH